MRSSSGSSWTWVGKDCANSWTWVGSAATAAGTSVVTRVGRALTRAGSELTRSRTVSMARFPAPTEARNGFASRPGSAGKFGRVLMVGRVGM